MRRRLDKQQQQHLFLRLRSLWVPNAFSVLRFKFYFEVVIYQQRRALEFTPYYYLVVYMYGTFHVSYFSFLLSYMDASVSFRFFVT